jgi:hypothetical protein
MSDEKPDAKPILPQKQPFFRAQMHDVPPARLWAICNVVHKQVKSCFAV